MTPDDLALIQAQLSALDAGGSDRRRRFRRFEVRCRGCGRLLAEVMGTSPYPVLVTRSGDRQTPWVITPLPEEHREGGLAIAACCTRHHVQLDQVAALLEQGEWKLVLDPERTQARIQREMKSGMSWLPDSG